MNTSPSALFLCFSVGQQGQNSRSFQAHHVGCIAAFICAGLRSLVCFQLMHVKFTFGAIVPQWSEFFCEARPLSLDHEHHSFFDLTTLNQIQEFQERESFLFSFNPVTKTSVPNHHHVIEQCMPPQQPQ